MTDLALSRTSPFYKFVFGIHDEWRLDGFKEPRNDRISLGLYIAMFAFMLVMRPIAFVMMTFFEVGILIISFLTDGSYSHGKFPMETKIIPIKPWPTIFGYRFPPWVLLVIAIISYTFYTNGPWEAAEVFVYCLIFVLIFRSIGPDSSSPAVELTEALEPVVDEKIFRAYYRKPKYFPTLHLID